MRGGFARIRKVRGKLVTGRRVAAGYPGVLVKGKNGKRLAHKRQRKGKAAPGLHQEGQHQIMQGLTDIRPSTSNEIVPEN